VNLEYKQEKKIIFKLHLHSIWSFRHPAKPLFMGFSAIFQATQTLGRRDLSCCFLVHICVFYSSYSSHFAFLYASSKIFRAKMEPNFFHKYNRKIACNEESTIVKFITSYFFCSKEASYSCDPFLYNILFLYIYSYKRMAIVQLI